MSSLPYRLLADDFADRLPSDFVDNFLYLLRQSQTHTFGLQVLSAFAKQSETIFHILSIPDMFLMQMP